jgi:hypothetical protein
MVLFVDRIHADEVKQIEGTGAESAQCSQTNFSFQGRINIGASGKKFRTLLLEIFFYVACCCQTGQPLIIIVFTIPLIDE